MLPKDETDPMLSFRPCPDAGGGGGGGGGGGVFRRCGRGGATAILGPSSSWDESKLSYRSRRDLGGNNCAVLLRDDPIRLLLDDPPPGGFRESFLADLPWCLCCCAG
jgi:hypothetical protein